MAEARQAAREAKDLIKQGIDPLRDKADKKRALEAELNRMTFAQAIDGWKYCVTAHCVFRQD